MTKIVLHGNLRKKFGREYELSIANPVEGIRALGALVPGFHEEFQKGNYYIYTGSGKGVEYLTEDTIKLSTNKTVHVVPEVAGAKSKGSGKLLAGIALIGIAFIPGLNVAAFGAIQGLAGMAGGGAATTLLSQASLVAYDLAAKAAFMGGLSMALGGAAQLIAPKVGESKDSNLFGGTPDSITEGTPVPLVYGEEFLAIGYPVTFELISGMNAYSGKGGSYGGGGTSGNVGGWTSVEMNELYAAE